MGATTAHETTIELVGPTPAWPRQVDYRAVCSCGWSRYVVGGGRVSARLAARRHVSESDAAPPAVGSMWRHRRSGELVAVVSSSRRHVEYEHDRGIRGSVHVDTFARDYEPAT